ncbi:hypothetical protein Tco_0961725 [Tanacetum coccineum]
MREEQNQLGVMQELLLKLMDDLQSLKGSQQEKKETAAQSFTPYWDVSMIDDEEARDNFLKDVCTFLRKFSHIPFGVTPKVILIAWESFGNIKDALIDKQYKQEDIQELMSKLLEDVRNISEEFLEYINCPSWNRPLNFNNDDEEYNVIWRRPKAITHDEPSKEPEDPLIMGEEELRTIPEKDKSSVEDLIPIPSGSKGFSDDILNRQDLIDLYRLEDEDAVSSINTHDYIPASPDYSPASPGNTSSDPSKDLSKDLLASLAISPFHDDPYMKVMQAYNATNNESPIPLPRAPIAPPTVLPPSLVLPPSPLFDPRDFFLPKEILPPQKRAHFQSPFSTDSFALPQVFEMGESSHMTRLERHEEQIVTILNHLDELPLKRIGHMEDKIEGLERANKTCGGHDDEIVLAHVRTSALEILIEDIQIRHRSDMKNLLDKIHGLKNHKEGPPNYWTRSLSFTAFVRIQPRDV